ncbi:MAG TPA: hypothetical protein VGS21_11500, partial [Acidimicrobiales bacterium]|nr:hypothetical protein [Acidimicrobiales bacterium]
MTARILTIMGSGETAPTMVKVHRSILSRLADGTGAVDAVLLDTPFGFQENRTEIAGRAIGYFKESLQTAIEVAGPSTTEPGDDEADQFADEKVVSRVRAAQYVFAGPGSPTYALRRWKTSVVPSLLLEKLQHAGAVTFASAAALTLGVVTIPVYEIYKVGEDPAWAEGLDLLGKAAGISAAVIPHYNNAEGGTHDTRFCYLGERRLSFLERSLPERAFVLGVDEHTSISFDLDSRVATIAGNGIVTIRAKGRSETFESGTELTIEEILATAERLASGTGPGAGTGSAPDAGAVAGGPYRDVDGASAPPAKLHSSPLLGIVHEQEDAFGSAIGARDASAAVAAVLELEKQIALWSADIPGSDEIDRARASLRSLIVELGGSAEEGVRDPRTIVGPFVESL